MSRSITAKGSLQTQTGLLRVKPSPKIVRAWFDTVINPMLSGVRIQVEYLDRRNWTWRYRAMKFEVIVSAEQYIDFRYRDNYQHLAAYKPEIRDRVATHTVGIERLCQVCEKLQLELQSSKDLAEQYRSDTTKEKLAELHTTRNDLFGGYPEQDHLGYLAELIINRTDKLPDYYTVHPYWNRYRDELIPLLDKPGRKRLKSDAERAAGKLRELTLNLQSYLEQLRTDLANKYGEPFVYAGEEAN